MKFVMDHWMLVLIALVSGTLLLEPMLRRGMGGLSPNDAVLLINRQHATVLDVRSAAEFSAGHITDALNIPLDALESRLGELAKYKEKPLLVNCQAGMRSSKACDVLRRAGFAKVHNLDGGINAWSQAKLPLIRES